MEYNDENDNEVYKLRDDLLNNSHILFSTLGKLSSDKFLPEVERIMRDINNDPESVHIYMALNIVDIRPIKDSGDIGISLGNYLVQSKEDPDTFVFLSALKETPKSQYHLKDSSIESEIFIDENGTKFSYVISADKKDIDQFYDDKFFNIRELGSSHQESFSSTETNEYVNDLIAKKEPSRSFFAETPGESDLFDENKTGVRENIEKFIQSFPQEEGFVLDNNSPYPSKDNEQLLDALRYLSPDSLAEAYSGVKEETYKFLWNSGVHLSEVTDSNYNIRDLWDHIPERIQDNILDVVFEKSLVKNYKNTSLISFKEKDDSFFSHNEPPVYTVMEDKGDIKKSTSYDSKEDAEKAYENIIKNDKSYSNKPKI